uniref:Peptidase M16 N-terminal domain-containing protein n=1 Tax=Lactuca sativa TaxID=4236 RepID=A0A9R1W585_LACSA|nr:hypothetical protein LSAT_V11C200053190 [Lactuca sativa]
MNDRPFRGIVVVCATIWIFRLLLKPSPNSTFDETLINRERGMILHKTEEMRAQTEEVIFDHLHSTAFQYTPLGRTILGPAENIQKIT